MIRSPVADGLDYYVRPPARLGTSVKPLADARDEREVGGKAHNLARLIALGAPVPAGIVVTVAWFTQFLDAHPLRNRIDALSLRLGAGAPDQCREASDEIRSLVTGVQLPAGLQCALEPIAREMGAGSCFAVRSSAVGEDTARASFAGQLDSILNVVTEEQLHQAIRTCWASYWSERALCYRAARGAALSGMGVIIQRQVPASVSGVLFTREPGGVAGANADDLVIEYCAGLGDRLVSGQVDPGRLAVSRTGPRVTTLAGGEEENSHLAEILTSHRILHLARVALRLEREFGGPQDIEWAIDGGGELWILQSRPITTSAGNTQRGGTPTVLWSNANVNENFPQPISPLLYSIASAGYYHYFRNLGVAFGVSRKRMSAMERPLRAIIGVHGARMYYNLTSIHSVLRTAPFGEHLAGAFNQFVGADEIAAKPPRSVAWSEGGTRPARSVELVRVAVKTAWQYLFLRRRLESFERTADEFAARTDPVRLQNRGLAELLEDLDSFLDIRCNRWKNASLADTAAMVCYALLQRAMARAGAGSGTHNRLLRALPGVPSSTPPLRLWELSRVIRSNAELRHLFATSDAAAILDTIRRDGRFAAFCREFNDYLDDWGFRSSAELMLTVPTLQEDPRPVIELLKKYAASDGEPPAAAMSRQAAERRTETSQLLRPLARRSPLQAAVIWLLLRWTQRAVVYRERARLKQALLYSRCRRVALRIGEHFVRAGALGERDEVFMLTWQEVGELGAGRAMFPYRVPELIALRRREHADLSAMRPPDTIRLPDGHYLALDAPSVIEPADVVDLAPDPSATLYGAGACGGFVTGRASVLRDVRDARFLERGDILVTRQTDPGWAPVFCLITGLVIERGGMLSHGAIIAREFGLPCVVGVKDATRRIRHGSVVTVDGDRGTCTIAAERSEQHAGTCVDSVAQGGAL